MAYQREANNSIGKGSVTVFRFKNNFFDAETISSKETAQENTQKAEKIIPKPQNATQEIPKPIQISERTTQEGVSKSQKIILYAIKQNPAITTRELAAVLNLTTDGAKWNLTRLKEKGIIRHTGATKKGEWEILKG
ncbi:MAG: winged helix-turn-helix transcriptional regulator [Endomicrobium sp.]|jgi:predicted HTH transcriptional regulator|nr:winged helix-turn-helix transcriptional regulator [Endomicrobium sp.]